MLVDWLLLALRVAALLLLYLFLGLTLHRLWRQKLFYAKRENKTSDVEI